MPPTKEPIEKMVWCGWCKYYTTEENFTRYHIPRHSKSLLDAAGYNKSYDNLEEAPDPLPGDHQ